MRVVVVVFSLAVAFAVPLYADVVPAIIFDLLLMAITLLLVTR